MPQLHLLKIGHGRKLHIPHNDKPLCDTNADDRGPQVVHHVLGDGVTCRNCLRTAEKINTYV